MSIALSLVGLLLGTVAFMAGLIVENNGLVLLGLILIPAAIVWGLVSAPGSAS